MKVFIICCLSLCAIAIATFSHWYYHMVYKNEVGEDNDDSRFQEGGA